jgi:hypothetical protein
VRQFGKAATASVGSWSTFARGLPILAAVSEGLALTEVRSTHDLASSTVSAAITTRGKELSAADRVADARRLFVHRSLQVIPVLDDGGAYDLTHIFEDWKIMM